MPRRSGNTPRKTGASSYRPASRREERPWWMRSSVALHPKQLKRLGWDQLPDVEVLGEYGQCKGCGEPLTHRAADGREPFCTRECRLLFHGLVDTSCIICGRLCSVRPEHAERPRCESCRRRHRDKLATANA